MAERLGEAVLVLSTNDRRLIKGIARARASAQRLGASFRRVGRQISTFVTVPLAALATVTARLADTQIQAERTLATVLKLSGGAAEQRLEGFKKFASAMQEITVVGDEVTLKNLQVAKSMGLTDEQAKRAAKNAIALSAAFGINAKSAIRYTAALEQGDTEMLNRYIPTLRQLKDNTERAAAAQRILEGAFEAAVSAAKEGLGPFRQMLNDLGDLGEEFGTLIIPAITEFAAKIRRVIGAIRALEPQQKRWLLQLTVALAVGGPILIGLGLLAALFGALLSPIGLVVTAVAVAGGAIVLLASRFDTLTEFIATNARAFLRWIGVVRSFSLDEMNQQVVTLAGEIDLLDGLIDSLQSSVNRFEKGDAGAPAANLMAGINEALAEDIKKRDALAAELGLVQDRIFELMFPPKIPGVDFDGGGGGGGANTPGRQAVIEIEDQTDALGDLAKAQLDAADAAFRHEQMMQRVGDSLVDAVKNVRDLDSALQALASILEEIVRAQLQGTSAGGGIGGILSSVLGGLGGLFGGGGGGFQPPQGASLSAGPFAHGGGFTVGGRGGVDRNLVQFKASRGEHVDITPAGKSGGGTTVFIDATGADPAALERMQQALIATVGPVVFEQRAVAAVVDAQRRGMMQGAA